MTTNRKWRGITALVLAAVIAACGDGNPTPTNLQRPAGAVTAGDDVVERVAVSAPRQASGACDWNVATGPTQTLVERYQGKGRPMSITLERNEQTCNGHLVVRPLPPDFFKKGTRKKVSLEDAAPVVAQAYEQTRAQCLAYIAAGGTPGQYATAQGMIYDGVFPTTYLAWFVLEIHTKRVNIGGNLGMNCVKADSLIFTTWSDNAHMWTTDGWAPAPADSPTPYEFRVGNQAPGAPTSWVDNAWCAGPTCQASLYAGGYRSFYTVCPYQGYIGEAHTFSDYNGTGWPAFFYIHARTDGLLQVAGWGGSAHGFPGTFTTCLQGDGFPMHVAYNVIAA